jgi:hypothetical protein
MRFSYLPCVLHVPPIHLPIDFVALIIFCEEFQLWSSTFSSLYPPATQFSLI